MPGRHLIHSLAIPPNGH